MPRKKTLKISAPTQSPPSRPRPGSLSLAPFLDRIASSPWTPVLLCLLFLANGLFAIFRNSGVCDELGAHIPSGYLFWKTGAFAGGVDNPPFGQLLIGSLVKMSGLSYELFSEQHLFWFRLPVLVLGLGLGILIFRFAERFFGRIPAMFSLFLYGLCPNILAHATVATLDIPIAFIIFLSVYMGYLFVQNPRIATFAGLCLVASLAMTTKIQGLLIVPLLVLFVAIFWNEIRRSPAVDWRFGVICAAMAIVIPFVTINLVYLHLPLIGGNGVLPDEFVAGVEQKLGHAESGHFGYLLGQYSDQGWWYYFPVAILFKTPLAVLLFLLVGLARRPDRRTIVFLFLPVFLFLGAAMTSRVNIGIRHILIVFPFFFLIAGFGASRFVHFVTQSRRASLGAFLLVGLLLLAHLIEAVSITPHHLSYFNLLAGGSQNGHRILIDSNFDWGQNDDYLAAYVARDGGKFRINPDPFVPTTGRILVNANALYGVLNGGPEAYRWLKRYAPIRQIAHTWFEYDVPERDYPNSPEGASSGPSAVERGQIDALRKQHESDPDPMIHVRLALLSISVMDYRTAFSEIRRTLALDPTHRQALQLGGELIVRCKLGILPFPPGDDYLQFVLSNR